jgi:hypothetical protein
MKAVAEDAKKARVKLRRSMAADKGGKEKNLLQIFLLNATRKPNSERASESINVRVGLPNQAIVNWSD